MYAFKIMEFKMKKIVAPDLITMLAAVIHDMTYPSFDRKNNVGLTSDSRMRAIKNTVCYSFGVNSGSALAYDLKFSAQKSSSENFKAILNQKFEKLNMDYTSRFGSEALNAKLVQAVSISLKVSRHPSGSYSLDYAVNKSGMYNQLLGVFTANSNPREFYESSFRLYHFLMRAGYEVDFHNLVKQEHLNSVLVHLDMDTRYMLRGWIYRDYSDEQDMLVRHAVDKKVKSEFEQMGLVYQANLFGDFGSTMMPMSLNAEGVLIPDIYFTKASLGGQRSYPYR